MKKALALLLAIIMVLSVFAGCSNEQEATTPPAEETKETTPVVEEVPEEPVVALTNAERYPIEGSPEVTILSTKEKDRKSVV